MSMPYNGKSSRSPQSSSRVFSLVKQQWHEIVFFKDSYWSRGTRFPCVLLQGLQPSKATGTRDCLFNRNKHNCTFTIFDSSVNSNISCISNQSWTNLIFMKVLKINFGTNCARNNSENGYSDKHMIFLRKNLDITKHKDCNFERKKICCTEHC